MLSKPLIPLFVLASLFLSPPAPGKAAFSPPSTPQKLANYTIKGRQILKDSRPVVLRGINAFDMYSVTPRDMQRMSDWKIDIAREVLGNMKNIPLTGGVQKVGSSWLYSLRAIVDSHRAHGRVTILCPFSWGEGQDDLFLGKNPSQTRWWKDYLAKYREWAALFKDEPDVWFELWNEPYAWNGANGYTHELWAADAKMMVDNIRLVAPNNIIVVPAGKMCGDEEVISDKGPEVLKGRKNIIFDVHAYNSWLPDAAAKIEARIRAVQDRGCALLFAETGASNAGYDLDPTNFLSVVSKLGISTLAWIWKEDPKDSNSLLGPGNKPSEAGKYGWGKQFYDFLQAPRVTEPTRRPMHVDTNPTQR